MMLQNNWMYNRNQGCYLVDYPQAFDKISKDYVLCVFEKKEGFGPDFLQWVCVLMSNTKNCVNYCGWLSDFFFSVDWYFPASLCASNQTVGYKNKRCAKYQTNKKLELKQCTLYRRYY